jgi:hypothetical protein
MHKSGRLILILCLLAMPRLGIAATCTWTGGAPADNFWSTAANWDNCGGAHAIPQNGDDLVFPAGAARDLALDDIPGLSVHTVQVTGLPTGLSYAIHSASNAIVLTVTGGAGALTFNAPVDSFGNGPQFAIATQMTAATTITNLGTVKASVGDPMDMNGFPLTLAATGGDLQISSNISNTPMVNTTGPHIVTLDGVSTFNGPVSIDSGTVRARIARALGSTAAGTTVHPGATLIIENSPFDEPLTLAGGQLSTNGLGVGLTGPVALTADTIVNTTPGVVVSFNAPITGSVGLTVSGGGTCYVAADSPAFTGTLTAPAGQLIVDANVSNATVNVTGGMLGGAGTAGVVTASAGSINPGPPPTTPPSPPAAAGRLTTGNLTLNSAATLAIEMNSEAAGGYDRLTVNGTVDLGSATLQPTLRFTPASNTVFTIIDNDGTDPIVGTFNGLPEGARFMINNVAFVISYVGGSGNDVTLTGSSSPAYYLSEGSTGPFFDSDILIANPNTSGFPVTVEFAKPDGSVLTKLLNLSALSRQTIHVDTVPGLEGTAFSTTVKSSGAFPLIVERSMFWDAAYYAGHTGSAVEGPAQDWVFAEGSQGFFNTYVLLSNPNVTPVDVTLTFLREADVPFVKTVTVAGSARLTVDCGSIPEIVNRSFGITVHGSQPITAERSMYFGNTPTRLFSGGHESAGVTTPALSWFLAEGATGGFFDTFVLMINPQPRDAHVMLQFLLDTGQTVTETKVIPANQRLTINIEAEPDPRLQNAAVSTVVTSDIPIVVERSMYWIGDVSPWAEAHNSFGVTEAGLHWGLAEGRIGTPLNYHTYILLANPQTTAASVTVTFMRENGLPPIVKTYTVPPTSRFNIDVNFVDPAMQNEYVGADVKVTNGVPIVVERSMYWDWNGVLFKGGTNATGVRLP